MKDIIETDRDKFVRLANKRVTNTIKAIQILGNLSNKGNYDYTEKDVDKIFSTLSAELKACRERFSTSGTKSRSEFRLE